MPYIELNATSKSVKNQHLKILGSKSESNRVLILSAFLEQLTLCNLSTSDDTKILQYALQTQDTIIDVAHAGTAMRFLTAYFAIQPNKEVVLTGSHRMQQRPIKPLVSALNNLGADITYLDKEGYPPLKIRGKRLDKSSVSLESNLSSQYVSALLLIAPFLERGLRINIVDVPTSLPYIKMTVNILRLIGCEVQYDLNQIMVKPMSANKINFSKTIYVESDWSSVSYFYSLISLSKQGATLTFSHFRGNSLQGDSKVAVFYQKLGVSTTFSNEDQSIEIKKTHNIRLTNLELDLGDTPDIAQTLAVTCLGLGLEAKLTGLHTLAIKETNRLHALKNELHKLGATVNITANTLVMKPPYKLKPNVMVCTYQDHRMAMAFAPLAIKTPIKIQNPKVVSKSYPNFWKDWEKILR